MRVYCKVCGQRGRITKTNRLSDDVSDLYCQFTDAECGHLVVRPHLKRLSQDYEPAGAELDGLTDARGAADGIERTGGAIAPLLVVFPVVVVPVLLTFVKKRVKNRHIDNFSLTKLLIV